MTAILEPQSAQVGEEAPEAVRPVPAPPATQSAPVRPATQSAPVRPPAPPRVRPVLSTRGVRIFGASMLVLFWVFVAVQPSPDGPDPVAPWWDQLISNAVLFGLVALFVGCVGGRRWTLPVGLGVGATLLVANLTCPLEGHHEIAAWWFVQMAVAVAMTVLPATLLRRTQAGSRAG
jgi:uncharacterized membrane protein AbrB (regulator of aidB expression)